jgi:predicted amidohydrolase YtcJ
MVRRAAADAAPGGWILGRGYDETHWEEGSLPTRRILDAAAPQNPVFLYRRDMHAALTNSLALKLADVDENTQDPPDGVLDREESGHPNGILRELAVNLVDDVVPDPTEDQTVEAMYQAMLELLRLGLTGVMDQRIMGGICGLGSLRSWQRLRAEGRIPMRVWTNIPGERVDEAVALGLRTGFGDDFVRIGHVKFFADGTVGTRTAWMLEPYQDAQCGMPLTPMEVIAEGFRKAQEAGLAVAVHAIGDRANRELIRILENEHRNRRPSAKRKTAVPAAPDRIEHVQMLRPEDARRLSRLRVVASVQPMHIVDDIPMSRPCLGENCRFLFPFRDLLDLGITVAFGSDCPVSDPNPMMGIHAAVNRCLLKDRPSEGLNPEQRISVPEAIRCYTAGPARVMGREEELGCLAVGKLADMVVWDSDILSLDPMDLHQVRPWMTIVHGRVVYRA